MLQLDDPPAPPRSTVAERFGTYLRRGGWLVIAAALAVAAVLATTIQWPPHYDALSRPAETSDALPAAVAERFGGALAPGSTRLLGVDGDTAYYLAAPAGVESGLCFIAAHLVDAGLSQVGCSSPGLNAGIQFADVTLSDHSPGTQWVEIAEDVWRDTTWTNGVR